MKTLIEVTDKTMVTLLDKIEQISHVDVFIVKVIINLSLKDSLWLTITQFTVKCKVERMAEFTRMDISAGSDQPIMY